MKISQKLKLALKSILELQLGEIATDKATLVFDGELAEGIEVFVKDENEELIPAEDGEYKAEEKVITVAEGKVAKIEDIEKPAEETEEKPAEENLETEVPAEKPVDEQEVETPADDERIAALETKVAEILEGIERVLNTASALEGRIADVEEKIAKLDTTPAEEPIDETHEEEVHQSKMSYLRK